MKYTNKEVYEKIFVPLIDIKYGLKPEQLSAAWLGLRLSKREAKTKFGYLENGSWTHALIDAYDKDIKRANGKIFLKTEITSINIDGNAVSNIEFNDEKNEFDCYLSTIEASELNGLLSQGKSEFKINYISSYSLLAGVNCATFKDYWTIAHTPRASFGGCFVLSNLNPTLITTEDKSVINCFTNVPYKSFSIKKDEFVENCKRDLETMLNKKIRFNWFKLNKINATSPIFIKNYRNLPSKIMKNLYVAGIYKTFPKLSSTGTAIQDGLETAKMIHEDLSK